MKRMPYFLWHFVMLVIALVINHLMPVTPDHSHNVFAVVAIVCAIIVSLFLLMARLEDIGVRGWNKFWVFILTLVPFVGFIVKVWTFIASSNCRLRGSWL